MRFCSLFVALLAVRVASAMPTVRAPKTVRAPALTANERETLRDWNFGEKAGALNWTRPLSLATPPRGKVSVVARDLQKRMDAIVEKLAGAALRDRGIHLVANIYRSGAAEISTRSYAVEAWPNLVTLLKLGTEVKTVHELHVPTKMLSGVDTEEELAFAIARNLAPLLEGENHRSQSDDFVVDKRALDLMRGKYELDGGLRYIERAARRAASVVRYSISAAEGDDALSSATRDHAHEGARMGAVQAYIEVLRRTHIDLAGSRALPDLQLDKLKPPHALPVAALPADQLTELLDDSEFGFSFINAGPEDATTRGRMVMQLVDRLKNDESVPRSKKVRAFFRLNEALYKTDLDHWAKLSDSELDAITRFLVENGSGPDGARVSDYIAGTLEHEEPRRLVRQFLGSPRAQIVFARLAKVSPSWREFVEHIPQFIGDRDQVALRARYDGKAKAEKSVDVRSLGEFLGDLERERHAGPLNAALKRSAIAYVESLPVEELVRQTDTGRTNEVPSFHYPEFLMLLKTIDHPFDEGSTVMDSVFHRELHQALSPARAAFVRYRRGLLDETFRTLADKKLSDEDFFHHLTLASDLFHSEAQVAFSEDEVGALVPRVLSLVIEINRRRAPERRAEPLLGKTGETPLSRRVLTSLLARKDIARSDKLAILRYLPEPSGGDRRRNGLSNNSLLKDERAHVASFMATLSNDELLALDDQDRSWAEGDRERPGTYLRGSRTWSFLALDPRQSEIRARSFDWKQLEGLLARGNARGARDDKGNKVRPALPEKIDNAAVTSFAMSMFGSGAAAPKPATPRHPATEAAKYSHDAAAFLLDVLTANQDRSPSLERWFRAYERIVLTDHNEVALDTRPSTRAKIDTYLTRQLKTLPIVHALVWLDKPEVFSLLSNDALAEILARSVLERPTGTKLVASVASVRKRYATETKHPGVDRHMSELLAEKLSLQPANLKTVFARQEHGLDAAAAAFSKEVRGLSAAIAETHGQAVPDQVHFIDFMMGRRDDVPDFVRKSAAKIDEVTMLNKVFDIRQQLERQDVPARVLFVNSFLAGPGGFLDKPGGRKQLLDHLLSGLSPKSQKLGRAIAEAALDVEGRSQSLALAYVLAQPKEKDAAGTDKLISRDAHLLKSMFVAYGVPGIKLAQYLAFTSEFAEFRDAFRSLQDAAMPLDYLEALELIDHRFGDSWPAHYKVKRVLGSGSVNVAIEYFDEKTQRTRVVSIARKDIEAETAHNFKRMRAFVDRFLADPERAEQYGYLKGLLGVIESSVQLEFDRKNALTIQHAAVPLYRRKVGKWKVQTLDAFDERNHSLFMEMGVGETARRVSERNPTLYAEAMKIMASVEVDEILGVDQSGNPRPVPLHANPDFHDGQVLIDERTHTLTLLDYGQALPLSNAERDAGIALLRVVSGVSTAAGAADRLSRFFPRTAGATSPPLDVAALRSVLGSDDRMDKFIRVLALLHDHGHDVPLSVVHWVLAVNRQVSLGERLGTPVPAQIRNLVLADAAHLDLERYNRIRKTSDRLRKVVRPAP